MRLLVGWSYSAVVVLVLVLASLSLSSCMHVCVNNHPSLTLTSHTTRTPLHCTQQQKVNKQPDFKQPVANGAALWIDNNRVPQWAREGVAMLPYDGPLNPAAPAAPQQQTPQQFNSAAAATPPPMRGGAVPPFIPEEDVLSGDRVVQAWVRLFVSYNDFWDNRINVS